MPPEKVNSDPMVFLRRFLRAHEPRLRTPLHAGSDEFLRWKEQVKKKLTDILGWDYMIPASPATTSHTHTVENGIRRERFFLQVEPDYWVPVLVNLPDGSEPSPMVLCPHGHCLNGKDGVSGMVSPYSTHPRELLENSLGRYRDTYAEDLARSGYLTVSFDNRDFNQAATVEPYAYHNDFGWHISHVAWQAAIGRSYVGSVVWDALKVFDYVWHNYDVDTSAAGCIGFSLGGLLSLYVSILEERIKATVISGYFDSYIEPILEGAGADCLCNYIPGLFAWFDIPDLTAAIAPRAVLCNCEYSADKRLERFQRHFSKVKEIYTVLGCQEKAELYAWKAEHHTFDGTYAYPWLMRTLSVGTVRSDTFKSLP